MAPKYQKGTLRAEEEKRRTVFKPLLDNPYTKTTWPEVEDGETLTKLLVELLAPLGTHADYIKKKVDPLPEAPEISDHVTVGFNCTMEAIEKQAQEVYTQRSERKAEDIVAIFVCRSDFESSLVVSHFPLSCCAASTADTQVKLVQLPKGSMSSLTKASGYQNLGVIGLRRDTPGAKTIFEIIEKIGNVEVPWINDAKKSLQPPVIKNMKTTAPIKVKKKK